MLTYKFIIFSDAKKKLIIKIKMIKNVDNLFSETKIMTIFACN